MDTDHNTVLSNAELQFKFSLGVSNALHSSDDGPAFVYYSEWSWGKHTVANVELQLDAEQERTGARLLRHSTLYLMMVQVDSVLAATVHDRFQHSDEDVRNASWISRLIRNAFAHDPFAPTWHFYSECRNRVFEVPDVCRLDTSDLEGKSVARRDFGGPLAALRLSQFVRERVIGPKRSTPLKSCLNSSR